MSLSLAMIGRLESRGLDIELADRIGLETIQRGGGEALVFPFVRNGEVVRKKYRRFDVAEGEKGKWSQDKDAVRCLFNEDALRDESLVGLPLILTEGEFDTLAAIQAGFFRTVSVPDGAPPPGERSAEDLETSSKYAWIDDVKPLITKDRAPVVILATDGDENGAALLQDLSILLGRSRCKYLVYPKSAKDRGRPRCKDLNEVLEDYGTKGVVETINRAQWLKVDGVYRMSELQPLPAMVIYEPRGDLIRQNIKIRLGDVSVWTGCPGFGKSTYLNDLLCGIAQDYDATIAWASFEQEPQRDHKRNLRTWFSGGDLFAANAKESADAWIDRQHVFIVPGEEDDPTLDWLLGKLETAVVRFGARVLVIDPWNEIEHSRERNETETEYIGRAIRALKRFARAFGVHICIVAHPTKSVKDADGNYKMPTLYDIAGSAHFYNKADLGVVIHREDEDNTIVKVQKSRYHEIIGRPGAVRMHFSTATRRYIETERAA